LDGGSTRRPRDRDADDAPIGHVIRDDANLYAKEVHPATAPTAELAMRR